MRSRHFVSLTIHSFISRVMIDFAGAESLWQLGTQNSSPKASLCPKMPFMPLCYPGEKGWLCHLFDNLVLCAY